MAEPTKADVDVALAIIGRHMDGEMPWHKPLLEAFERLILAGILAERERCKRIVDGMNDEDFDSMRRLRRAIALLIESGP